jgi:hypothetical protein
MFHCKQRWFAGRGGAGLLTAALFFAALGVEHSASAGVVEIRVAPPEARVEPPPRHSRPHHVWANGYWAWNGHRHVWVQGRYVPERRGYVYRQARWERTPHGNWRLHDGGWYRR